MAGPSSPSALKRKADELEEKVGRAELGEEGKHGSTEAKRTAKRRKKNKNKKKKKKKKKDNGSKRDDEHKDGKAISEGVAGEVDEAESTQAKRLEDEAVDRDKTADSNSSAPKPKKEEKDKKKDKKEKILKKGQKRKQSDHETPGDQPNGKKRKTRNSSDEEYSEKDKKKKGKRKSTPSPSSPSPHPDNHHTTPPSTKTVTTPKSLLKKSSNKTPTPHTKTVTFADDAKSTDGDSIANTIRFPGDIGGRSNIPRLPGSPQPHPALLEQQSSPSSSSSPTTTTQQGTLPHSPDLSEDRNQQQNTKPQIAYLLNYYQARSSWKFSKTKQNWIIRNIWNLAEFNAEVLQSALWAYVNGLAAQGPKDRLLAEAKEVAKTRREELGPVHAEDDPKYRRAKLVLTALGDDDIPSEDEGDDDDADGGVDSDTEENVE
ncbi:hypothetical protein C7212DRAFT_232367 [Tuber magnatum]|uniref:WKF domain-containing protein n=1 Tax=Tuber magnatum TaxID=42249 RepID=A0A317SGT6_9PEZI|nr:hypothetical protein C7212DRAFT_232367 [Tuber magnatum]